MYKELTIEVPYIGQKKHIIRDNGDGHFTSFPAEEDNPNYQAYLKWVSEGNQPESAEETQ